MLYKDFRCVFDEKLTWSNHIQYIKKKIAKNIGVLHQAKSSFRKLTLFTLYYSFIYPYLSYGIEMWGLANKMYTNSILKLQKRCCKIIAGVPMRTSSDDLFKSLNILCFSNIYEYCLMLFMYRFYYHQVPILFEKMFCRKPILESINTRHSHFFIFPRCKLKISFNSVKCKGPSLWNAHCSKIDYNCSLSSFKARIRKFLLM